MPKRRTPARKGDTPTIGPPTEGDFMMDTWQQFGGVLPTGVAAIPPGIAKQAGKMMVEGIKDPFLRRVWEALQELYPRNVGHVDSVQMEKLGEKIAGVRAGRGFPNSDVVKDATNMRDAAMKWSKLGPIRIDPNQSLNDVIKGSRHELEHTGQAVRDVNFPAKYEAQARVLPHDMITYERRAMKPEEPFLDLWKEAKRTGSTPKQVKVKRAKVRGEIKGFNRRPVPGSMAEFSPMASHTPSSRKDVLQWLLDKLEGR